MATLGDFKRAFPKNAEDYFEAATAAMARHGIEIADCLFQKTGADAKVSGIARDNRTYIWIERLPE